MDKELLQKLADASSPEEVSSCLEDAGYELKMAKDSKPFSKYDESSEDEDEDEDKDKNEDSGNGGGFFDRMMTVRRAMKKHGMKYKKDEEDA
jgi:hypothetical protein